MISFYFPPPFINFIFCSKSSLVSSRSFPLHFLFFFLSLLFIIIFRASFCCLISFYPSVRPPFLLSSKNIPRPTSLIYFVFIFEMSSTTQRMARRLGLFVGMLISFDAYTYIYYILPVVLPSARLSSYLFQSSELLLLLFLYCHSVVRRHTVVTGPFFLVLFSPSVVCVYTHY